MNTILTIDMAHVPNSIKLGRCGENHMVIHFDCTSYQETYGIGNAALLFQPARGPMYPVVIEQDGALISWRVSSFDTSESGTGLCELSWYVGDMLVKSQQMITIVYDSLSEQADETCRTDSRPWMDQILQAGVHAQRAQSAAETAQHIADTIGYVTPERFGAAGDGITDDTQAIQSALDTRKSVRLSASTYLITRPLFLRWDTGALIGDSASSSVLRWGGADSDAYMLETAIDTASGKPARHVTIANLLLDAQALISGIHIPANVSASEDTDGTISHIRIVSAKDGLRIDANNSGMQLQAISIENSVSTGAYIAGVHHQIAQLTCIHSGKDGIVLETDSTTAQDISVSASGALAKKDSASYYGVKLTGNYNFLQEVSLSDICQHGMTMSGALNHIRATATQINTDDHEDADVFTLGAMQYNRLELSYANSTQHTVSAYLHAADTTGAGNILYASLQKQGSVSSTKGFTDTFLQNNEIFLNGTNLYDPKKLDSYIKQTDGVLSGDLNAQAHTISNLKTPTANQDAATKKYVDDVCSSVVSAAALKPIVLDLFYPIGTIYHTAAPSFDPADAWGGIWVRIKDTFLLAAGAMYAGGSTGGEATHTLTAQEMPSHTHLMYVNNDGSSSGWTPAIGTHLVKPDYVTMSTKNYSAKLAQDSAGNGQTHNNMPPYLTVYVWKRTA